MLAVGKKKKKNHHLPPDRVPKHKISFTFKNKHTKASFLINCYANIFPVSSQLPSATEPTSGCPKWETQRQVQMAPVSSYNLSNHITAHEPSIDHSEIKDPCFIQSQTPLIPNFASITSLISYRHSQHAALYVGIVVITHRHKCYFLLCLGFFLCYLFYLPIAADAHATFPGLGSINWVLFARSCSSQKSKMWSFNLC